MPMTVKYFSGTVVIIIYSSQTLVNRIEIRNSKVDIFVRLSEIYLGLISNNDINVTNAMTIPVRLRTSLGKMCMIWL